MLGRVIVKAGDVVWALSVISLWGSAFVGPIVVLQGGLSFVYDIKILGPDHIPIQTTGERVTWLIPPLLLSATALSYVLYGRTKARDRPLMKLAYMTACPLIVLTYIACAVWRGRLETTDTLGSAILMSLIISVASSGGCTSTTASRKDAANRAATI